MEAMGVHFKLETGTIKKKNITGRLFAYLAKNKHTKASKVSIAIIGTNYMYVLISKLLNWKNIVLTKAFDFVAAKDFLEARPKTHFLRLGATLPSGCFYDEFGT